MVQKFTTHTKAIISIVYFDKKQLFLTCSLDNTIRMYSMTSFKELYALTLKEKPLGMNKLDEVSFYVYTAKKVMTWTLNHINSLFTITK